LYSEFFHNAIAELNQCRINPNFKILHGPIFENPIFETENFGLTKGLKIFYFPRKPEVFPAKKGLMPLIIRDRAKDGQRMS
jgi:hypothetical protein